jgi:hypothetical protein
MKCAWEGCEEVGENLSFACGRAKGHQDPDYYCNRHYDKILDEAHPEYVTTCPNCGCTFGVN